MDERKTNAQAVADYHKQIKDIKIRIPAEDPEKGIPDYYTMILERAAELQGIDLSIEANRKKVSVNKYVLDLISKDIGTEIKSGVKAFKK